jgi:endonuclease YncB( thermonuclease family)
VECLVLRIEGKKMKKLLLLLLVPYMCVAATIFQLPIINIYDGDTIQTNLFLPEPLNAIEIRVLGIDTPEMPAASYKTSGKLGRASCKKEAELALAAKEYLNQLAIRSHYIMTISNYSWDKYGGRIDADVYFGDVNVAQALLANGMAKPYDGTGSKPNWCL